MALTQEAILSFLLEHGGKVKNSELLNHFRSHINHSDPAEKQHNREVFKRLVNSVAVVKQIDQVKFVVVKKKYRDFIKGLTHDAPQETQTEDSFSPNTTISSTSDFENNNICCASNLNDCYFSDSALGNMQQGNHLSKNVSGADATTVKVLNICRDEPSRPRKSAVFAVIAVKSPTHPQRHPVPSTEELHSQIPLDKTEEKSVVVGTKAQTLNPHPPSCEEVLSVSKCGTNRQIEETPATGFPVIKPQIKATRQGDDVRYSESVPLEPLAHEWLCKCAAGLWGQIYALLLQDTQLVKKKDFMSGFTALHWAAKGGNTEMLHKIMNVSRKRGIHININSKTHGGYTPLHIAAIHSHAEVMVVLVKGYGANTNVRDNDGKKPYHYLAKGVSAEVRALLGGLQHSNREKMEDEEYRDQPKGFNTISKLFQPHKKQKATTKFGQDC